MTREFTAQPEEFSWQPYRARPYAVWAMRMNEDFTCTSLNGTIAGKSGDWLVRADDGWTFPVADDIFRRTYVKREWRRPDETKGQQGHERHEKAEGVHESRPVHGPA